MNLLQNNVDSEQGNFKLELTELNYSQQSKETKIKTDEQEKLNKEMKKSKAIKILLEKKNEKVVGIKIKKSSKRNFQEYSDDS